MRKERLCGIYKLTNLDNNKIYIGKSINLYQRKLLHKAEFKNGTHGNPLMRKEMTPENFDFEIIELCDKNKLEERENYWILKLKSNRPEIGYNLKLLQWMTPIYLYDFDGITLIKKFKSQREACEKTGIAPLSIRLNALGIFKKTKAGIWKYKKIKQKPKNGQSRKKVL